MTGRGSWTPAGGTYPVDGAGYYQLMSPMVGSQVRGKASVDPAYTDYRAVWAGVRSIQAALNREFQLGLLEDGTFGPATDAAVKTAQWTYGLRDGFTPGRVGSTLATRLFRHLVVGAELKYHIPRHALAGVLYLESGGFDPGSVGEANSADGGLAQFHVDGSSTWWMKAVDQPEVAITHRLAFDAVWAVTSAAIRMAFYRARYASKPALVDVCAIAQHNAPASADLWYRSGTAPNSKIANYVTVAQRRAQAY